MGSKSAFSGSSQAIEPSWRGALETLDGDFVAQACHDDLAIAGLTGAGHGQQVAVEDADVFHAHANHLEQVVRPDMENSRIDLQPCLDIFFGQNRPACGHPADERQTHLLAQRVFELYAARGPGHQRDDALAGQGAQVVLGCVRGLKAQLLGDFLAGGRHAGFLQCVLDETQDLRLAWGEFELGHDGLRR